jgi:hypothetical protein
MTPLASLRQRLTSNVARPFLDAADDRSGSFFPVEGLLSATVPGVGKHRGIEDTPGRQDVDGWEAWWWRRPCPARHVASGANALLR